MYLFFDTETTGLYDFKAPPSAKHQPHLVQLGAILTDMQGNVMAHVDLMVEPDGWDISDEVSKVHGITTQLARQGGVPIRIALSLFSMLCRHARTLIAHNLSFDTVIMEAQYARLGVDHRMHTLEKICTMKTGTEFVKAPTKNGRSGYKWPSLMESHIHYTGQEFKHAHRAMSDVIALMNVFWAMKKSKHLVCWPESNLVTKP